MNPCIVRRSIGLVATTLLWYSTHCQNSYVVEYLGFADGLPSLNICGIAQDSDGLIWFAAFGTGLIRYDGTTFKVFNQSPESKPRLTNNDLRDIILDRKGRLWIAHNAGIHIVQPNTLEIVKFIPLDGNDETVKGQACSLCLTPDGDIWVASFNKGVFRFPDSDPNRIEFIEAVPEALYINQTPDGKIYCISSNSEIYCYESGHFVSARYEFPAQSKGDCKINPIENQEGLLTGFMLVRPNGVTHAYHLNLQTNRFTPGLPEDGITALSSTEISRRMLETASPLDKIPLFYHPFRSYKDNLGVIWVAPEYGGVFKLKPREIAFTSSPDLKGVSLRGMIELPDGSIFIATYNGLFQYFPSTNRTRQPKRTWKDIFYHLAQIRGDTVTALSESQGLVNYNLSAPWKFTEAPTSQLTRDFSFYASMPLDEEWLLAGNQQIFRFRPKDLRVEPFCVLPASPAVRCFCFKPARDGRIWVGTTEGVFVLFRDGRCEAPSLRQDHRLSTESRINDIFEAENGKIWFATHAYGLLCYDPATQQIQDFDQSSGFASNETYKIASSQAGKTIWVSTFSGLQCIELPGNKIHYFNESDGTSGSEFNTGSFLQSRSGAFYFGGVRGLTRFDPNQFHPISNAPPVPYITELFIEDVYSNIITTVNQPNRDTMLHLSHGQNTLVFHFGSNDYFRPKSNTYFVKLENIDADWVSLGSLSSLKYYHLASGKYTLRVKLNINGDKESSQIWSISFEIEEVFYKKWWFISILGISLLGIIWGVIQMRRRRFRREEDLRRSIAHNLHNSLGGKISGISNMLYVIDKLNKSGQPFQSELHQMLDLTRKAHSTMSDVIWVLARKKDINRGLINRMQDYADKWLKLAHINVAFEHNLVDHENSIPFTIQHELLLIYKEMLGNILKHTFSDNVYIRFINNPDKSIELSVTNMFSDRKKDVPSGGQGLSIMQELIERIGGKLKIRSEENRFEAHVRFENPVKSWRNK